MAFSDSGFLILNLPFEYLMLKDDWPQEMPKSKNT